MRLLVVNPYASGVTEEGIAKVAAALGDVEVRRTEHRGHATELVASIPMPRPCTSSPATAASTRC